MQWTPAPRRPERMRNVILFQFRSLRGANLLAAGLYRGEARRPILVVWVGERPLCFRGPRARVTEGGEK